MPMLPRVLGDCGIRLFPKMRELVAGKCGDHQHSCHAAREHKQHRTHKSKYFEPLIITNCLSGFFPKTEGRFFFDQITG